jgi:hypothetical protein
MCFDSAPKTPAALVSTLCVRFVWLRHAVNAGRTALLESLRQGVAGWR